MLLLNSSTFSQLYSYSLGFYSEKWWIHYYLHFYGWNSRWIQVFEAVQSSLWLKVKIEKTHFLKSQKLKILFFWLFEFYFFEFSTGVWKSVGVAGNSLRCLLYLPPNFYSIGYRGGSGRGGCDALRTVHCDLTFDRSRASSVSRVPSESFTVSAEAPIPIFLTILKVFHRFFHRCWDPLLSLTRRTVYPPSVNH